VGCFYGRPKRRQRVNVGIVPGGCDIRAGSVMGATGTRFITSPGSAFLRVGMQSAAGRVGEGPDGTTANPYRVLQWNPHSEGLANLKPVLDIAQQQDILLIVMVAGSSTNYGGGANPTSGGPPRTYDAAGYQNQLDKLSNAGNGQGARLSTMLRNRTALCYFGDEPHAATWDRGPTFTPRGGYSPAQWNGSARLCKTQWPGCLTFGRMTPTFHRSGWLGWSGMSAAECDAIDYGWLQYNAGNRKQSESVAVAIADEEAIGFLAAGNLNMGVAFSLNLANAGYRVAIDGLNPCWDTQGLVPGNPSSGSGIVVGAGGSPLCTTLTDGEYVPCGQVLTEMPNGSDCANRNIVAMPSLVRRAAVIAAANSRIPFMVMWAFPGPDAPGESDVLIPYFFDHPDWVAARTDAMTTGLGRAAWTGYRTPKP
jgi:hypothetical protein